MRSASPAAAGCTAWPAASEIAVNSLHNQGVDRLAPGLVTEGVAPDGTIEAVRVVASQAGQAPGFAVGVQWHPEYDWRTDTVSRAIFEQFGAAVRGLCGLRAARRGFRRRGLITPNQSLLLSVPFGPMYLFHPGPLAVRITPVSELRTGIRHVHRNRRHPQPRDVEVPAGARRDGILDRRFRLRRYRRAQPAGDRRCSRCPAWRGFSSAATSSP